MYRYLIKRLTRVFLYFEIRLNSNNTLKMSGRILCQLKSETGELLGAPIDLPLNVDKLGLEKLCQALLSSVNLLYSTVEQKR